MKKWKDIRGIMRRKLRFLEYRIREIGEVLKYRMSQTWKRGAGILKDSSGISTIELLLLLVVIIAIVLIFKNQLTSLVTTIFDKITSESAGI